MGFLIRHLYMLAPVFAIVLLFGVYRLIHDDNYEIPKYESDDTEDTWSPEEYIRHLNRRPFSDRAVHQLLIRRTRQKAGVYLESLLPAMDTAGLEVVHCFHLVLGDDYVPVITSGNDYPFHARNSKHYQNAALDFRIKYIPYEDRKQIVELVQKKLEDRFRVLWEKGEAEHLHVELLKP